MNDHHDPNKYNLNHMKERLRQKPEVADFLDEITANPEILGLLFEIIRTDKGAVKFYCEKVIRMLSEKQPSLAYPYFDDVANLIDSQNSFVKWGAITTLSNLIDVDNDRKFEAVCQKYLDLINSDSMITAASAVKNVWKFVVKNPDYEGDLTKRLLGIADNTYLYKGKPSPECKNIMFGNAIDCFDKYFEISCSKKDIIEFVAKQRNNTRKQVAKKAEAFLKKHLQ
ncbi:MAG: hypothetical protein ACOYEQ_00910 [Bacillota bacterium]|jgi:hypothetical protein